MFVHLPPEEVEERIEAAKDELEAQIAEATAEIQEIQGTLAELKVLLKSKFKDSINLEENPDK